MTPQLLHAGSSAARRMPTRVVLLVLSSAAAGVAQADELLDALLANAPSSISIDAGTDSEDVASVTVALDVGLPNALRIQSGFANTWQRSATARQTGTAFWIGAASDPLATLAYGARYERMNSSDLVYSDTVDASLAWSPSNWEFSWYPGYRTISVQRPLQQDTVRIRNPGLGFQIGYHWNSVSLSGRHDTARYYSGVESLSGLTAEEQRALARDGQLYTEHRNAVVASLHGERGSLSVQASRSVSVIDGNVERGLTVDATVHVSRDFDVRGYAGGTRNDLDEDFYFGGLGIAMLW
jgi:hypothetical protein